MNSDIVDRPPEIVNIKVYEEVHLLRSCEAQRTKLISAAGEAPGLSEKSGCMDLCGGFGETTHIRMQPARTIFNVLVDADRLNIGPTFFGLG